MANMKQASIKLPSGEYLIQEVPEGALSVMLHKGSEHQLLTYVVPMGADYDYLPPGSWQLLGADPTNLTEEEAKSIVDVWDNVNPVEEVDSLAESLGIEKPYVILKLKTDNNDK